MGYTLTFKPKDKNIGNLMIEFMEIERLKSKIPYEVYPHLCSAKDLSYCNKRGHIGFDYSGFVCRELAYILTHWLISVGGKEKFYYYDGEKTELSEERLTTGIKKEGYEEFKEFGWDVNFAEEILRLQTAWFHFYLRKTSNEPYNTGGYIQ